MLCSAPEDCKALGHATASCAGALAIDGSSIKHAREPHRRRDQGAQSVERHCRRRFPSPPSRSKTSTPSITLCAYNDRSHIHRGAITCTDARAPTVACMTTETLGSLAMSRQQAFDHNVAASRNERCKTDSSGVLLDGASCRNIFIGLLDDGPPGDVCEPAHDRAIRLPHGNLAASTPTRRLPAPRGSSTVTLEAHTLYPLLSPLCAPVPVPPPAGICARSL